VNKTQKQVEAHNAQQREKVDAKRERERSSKVEISSKGDRRGKRVIRRVDNGQSRPSNMTDDQRRSALIHILSDLLNRIGTPLTLSILVLHYHSRHYPDLQ
jgi:hypothetical protein